MKTPIARCFAAALGLAVGAGFALDANADEPSNWNSFRMPSTELEAVIEGMQDSDAIDEGSRADQIKQVAMQGQIENLPAPVGRPMPIQQQPGFPQYQGYPQQGYPQAYAYPPAPYGYQAPQYPAQPQYSAQQQYTAQPQYGYAAPGLQQPFPQQSFTQPQPQRFAANGMQNVPMQPAVASQQSRRDANPNAGQFGANHYSVGHHGEEHAAPVLSGDPVVHEHHSADVHQSYPDSYASPYASAAAAPWQGAPCGDGGCGDPSCSGCGTGSCGMPSAASCDTGSCGSGSCGLGGGCASGGFAGACGTSACGGVGPISPWYGGMDLLFWEIADSSTAVYATYDNGVAVGQYNYLDPDNTVGVNTRFGRYLGCGAYGIDVSFLYWDPDPQSRMFTDGGAGLRFTHPALRTVSINRGGGATTVYDDYDTNATCICSERDIRVKGIEVNLSCFGLMGARRLGSAYPTSLFAGHFGGCGSQSGYGSKGGCFGRGNRLYGSAIGPLARACSGRVRVQTSHGFRWFQLEDELLIAGDVDGMPGLGGSDIYYELQTENNLYGYQFGSQLSYALGCRLMVNIGGKVGVYGNDARFTHWIGNDMVMAYTDSQGAGAGDLYTEKSDVSLAGLGELDFGLGYRVCNRLTATCGYRILTACGVATSIDSMPDEYTSVESAGRVRADDCFTMFGAYFGFNYNW
ncbi:BBP7 family outer membrane beta-barrel protein [Stieleria sp. JC731]|uniref:BBP7 family outer membrane beta-barrel protein n=1 Tax=Pirellulaceae TaxID=2691357 RepID=UPI001E343B61|nr:BBP7 family outer membrane beta-barrel protein [Stieleria sp. JC731]MCC9601551.1 BBP7 family outer membrane beta-barrel protein [Stieleria sp. JC731]